MVGKNVCLSDRETESACSDQDDVVLSCGAQNRADLTNQRVDVVANAALAKGAEAREIAPDLRRIDMGVLADLMRGNRSTTGLLRLR